MTRTSNLAVTNVGDVAVVSFAGAGREITQHVLLDLSAPLLAAVPESSPRILVDLDGVRFFGSSFIELLFRVWNRVRSKAGGEFALCNVDDYCREVLDVTNLSKLWRIFPSRDAALGALTDDANAWSSQIG